MQFNNLSNGSLFSSNKESLTRRKRIVITIDKPNKKTKNPNESDSFFNPSK
jgi:hypothetical protein